MHPMGSAIWLQGAHYGGLPRVSIAVQHHVPSSTMENAEAQDSAFFSRATPLRRFSTRNAGSAFANLHLSTEFRAIVVRLMGILL